MRCIDRSAADMETKNKKYLIILGVVAAVILAILAFIGIMVGVSLKSLTTQEREFIDQSYFRFCSDFLGPWKGEACSRLIAFTVLLKMSSEQWALPESLWQGKWNEPASDRAASYTWGNSCCGESATFFINACG